MALVDELDLLVQENRDRRFVTVLGGLLTLSLILVLESWTFGRGLGAAVSFGAFLAVMVKPIRRFQRIHELKRELECLGTASELPGSVNALSENKEEAREVRSAQENEGAEVIRMAPGNLDNT